MRRFRHLHAGGGAARIDPLRPQELAEKGGVRKVLLVP